GDHVFFEKTGKAGYLFIYLLRQNFNLIAALLHFFSARIACDGYRGAVVVTVHASAVDSDGNFVRRIMLGNHLKAFVVIQVRFTVDDIDTAAPAAMGALHFELAEAADGFIL